MGLCGEVLYHEGGETEPVPKPPEFAHAPVSFGHRLKGGSKPVPVEIDGKPVTCHLDAGHDGYWHRWDHENHVVPGEAYGAGMLAWHTELGKEMMDGIGPIRHVLRQRAPGEPWHTDFSTHVFTHPIELMVRENMPCRPKMDRP